jgi:hypothetical protein
MVVSSSRVTIPRPSLVAKRVPRGTYATGARVVRVSKARSDESTCRLNPKRKGAKKNAANELAAAIGRPA